MPGQILYGIQGFRILFRQRQPLVVTGQLVCIPNITGKEAGAPVINGNIMNAAILINGTRIKNFT